MKLSPKSAEAKRLSDLIINVEINALEEIKLQGNRYRPNDKQRAQDTKKLAVEKGRTSVENISLQLETLGQKAPKGYSEAMRELEHVRSRLNASNIDEQVKLFDLYERSANAYLEQAVAKMGVSKLDDEATKRVTEAIAARSGKLADLKMQFSEELVAAYKKLPKLKQTKARAESINKLITDNEGRLATKVLSVKGRVLMFGAQFATVMAAQVAVETLMDKDHDLVTALGGLASMDTLQMLVDLIPGVGTLSNAMSVITGVKSLSTFGVEFQDNKVNRLESAGWGLVSLGSDVLMFVPVAGVAVKGGVIAGRLAALAPKFPAAAKLLAVWPKVEAFAAKVGWDKALPAVISLLQKNIKGINIATTAATVGMTTYTAGKIAVAYGQQRELELAKPAA